MRLPLVGVGAGEIARRDGITDHAAGSGVIEAESSGDGGEGGLLGGLQLGRNRFDDLDILDLTQATIRFRRSALG
ncbi:hypothetical protein [Nocardia sp. NPDC047648]|uniref:hypothetical protein n=1 Tax=Nocardia sp. NPDC047648 TaxID=3155625 RepID=UPI0033DAF750